MRHTGRNETLKEEKAGMKEDGGQKKKSKQIKFDLPSEASDQCVDNSGSVSGEGTRDDGVTSTVETTLSSINVGQVETLVESKRITYDRVCTLMP